MTGTIKAIAVWLIICIIVGYPSKINGQTYRRCSLTQMMLNHPMYPFNDQITTAFKEIPWNERFNNHDLGVKVVKFATQEFTDQTNAITIFLDDAKVANRSVAKWFGWNPQSGEFNMNLVKLRGFYDSSELDKRIAGNSIRGYAILEDAGENLIPNTFLIMNDICFTGEYSNKKVDFDKRGKQTSFTVTVTSYIFSLDWSNSILDEFYQKFYIGDKNFISNAKYRYIYQAKVKTEYKETSSKLTQKELIKQVVGRTLDINIAKLTKVYPKFKIMAPIISVDPLQCEIGQKEGITDDSKFEVLEIVKDSNGIQKYNVKGIVKVKPGTIMDNRYSSVEDFRQSNPTEFIIEKGSDFYPGMLLREL